MCEIPKRNKNNPAETGDVFPCRQPSYPAMAVLTCRIMTFLHNWPNHIAAKPCDIAKAGFYCLALRDRVKCFYCGGGLQNWKEFDDPWFEHAKWYPNCEFVLKSKGIDFVEWVTSFYPDIERPLMGKRLQSSSNAGQIQGNTTETAAAVIVAPLTQQPIAAADGNQESRESAVDVRNNPGELLSAFVDSDIARVGLGLGFDVDSIKAVAAKKIDTEGITHQTSRELICDLQLYEKEMDENLLSTFNFHN